MDRPGRVRAVVVVGPGEMARLTRDEAVVCHGAVLISPSTIICCGVRVWREQILPDRAAPAVMTGRLGRYLMLAENVLAARLSEEAQTPGPRKGGR